MTRIVVEEEQLFGVRLQAQRDSVVHTAMPPACMCLIFFRIKLGINNDHIAVSNEFGQSLVVQAAVLQ